MCALHFVLGLFYFVGLAQAQETWSTFSGMNGPGNSSGTPVNYWDCPTPSTPCIPGTVNWPNVNNFYRNTVEGLGWTTSSGVGCGNVYKVGTTTVSSVAQLPASDRAVFKGFSCVNDVSCTPQTLGPTPSTGTCSMTRFLKVTQVAQGMDTLGTIYPIPVGPGTWGDNISIGEAYTCPQGQVMTNMRCYQTSTTGCLYRQVECANFANAMFRMDTLPLNGGPFNNRGTTIPSPDQWGRFIGANLAFTGLSLASNGDLTFTISTFQIKSCTDGYTFNASFSCVGKPCPSISAPANGLVSFSSTPPTYPATANFSCNAGYATTQVKLSQCLQDSNGAMYWNYPAPTCTGVPCAPLGDPSNGKVTVSNYNQYPSTANYSCNAGYVVDIPSATCLTTGFWSPSTSATCVGVPCRNDSSFYVANGGSVYPTTTNSQRYPSTATYTCLPGYSISSAQRLCQSDGTWFPTQPTCTGVPCPQQSPIANGNVSQTSLVFPANATYTCSIGFQLVGGSAVRPCATDGTFVGSVPSCNPIPCVLPNASSLTPLNLNATPSFTSGVYPSTITYACLTGYYPTSSLTYSCNATGSYPLPSACIARSINVTSRLINSISTSIFPVTNAVANLTFYGSFGPTAPSNITFGPPGNPLLYSCTSILFNSATQSVRCTASPGVGSGLTIAVTLSNPSGAVIYVANFLSYIAPVLRNSTLRATGNAGVGVIQSTNPSGDSLTFLCDHCGTVSSQLTVSFGAPQGFGITCGSITSVTSTGDTQNVSCVIGAAAGGPYQFYVTAGGVSAVSGDTYRYPDGPVISNVSGCSAAANGGTSDCPCSGGSVVLTIRGSLLNYSSPVSVKIAQIEHPAFSANASVVTVALPAGVGTSISVQVIAGTYQSQVAFLLSYGAPIISSVSGCVNTTQCRRDGTSVITLSGSNFGSGSPAPLVVLVGTYSCNNVVHDASFPDSQVTCTLSPGKGTNLGIFAIQPNGLLASSPLGVSLSYDVCYPGTYENQTGLDCIACPNGTFSSVSSQSSCSQCAAGTYGPVTGLSSCWQAGQGYYVSIPGSSSRLPCPSGYFTADTTAIACEVCSPGTYANVQGALTCISCPVGMASAASASTNCSLCAPGTYSPQQGATACTNCNPGWAAPSPGAVGCLQCGAGSYSDRELNCSSCLPGTFQNQVGSTICVQCDPGRYSNVLGSIACTACSQGQYQSGYGATSCADCPSGSASAQFGVTACSVCIQGTQQNRTGQLTCSDCPVGKQALYPGSSTCDDCLPGKFAATTRTALCLDCLVSTATNLSGQSSCPQCERGTFAAGLGLSVCSPCTAGKFASELGTFVCSSCPPGAIAETVGASTCASCTPGTFAKSSGQTMCEHCTIGTFSSYQGATVCSQCPPGTYGNSSGLAGCSPCPAGSFSSSPASKECDLCLPGKFSIGNTDSCTSCSSRTIALSSGAAACSACPNNAVANTQLTDCICGPGFLRVSTFMNGVDNLDCHTCYTGANCSQAGTTAENVQTLPGWWRSSLTSTTYYRCLVAAFCAGGLNSDCAGNRAGPLCVSCAPGYRSSRATSSCDICPPSQEESWTYSILIMIAVGVAAVFVYWAVLRLGDNQAKQLKADKDHTKLQVLNSFRSSTRQQSRMNLSVNSVDDTSDSSLSIDEYEPKKKKDEDMHSLASRRAPNFMYKIKIVIGFFQIANVISFQGDISWPQLYQSFITIFQVLNLDFVPWQSIGCATNFDFYWKAVITGLIPVAVFILLLIGFVVPSVLLERREKYTDADTKRLRGRRMRAQLMKLILFTVFLLYPHVSSSVLGVFNCIEVEGVHYLMNDFSLICFDERWNTWALPCIVFVIAYPIGIPLAYFFILRRNKAKFQDVDTIVAYGFLYEAYQDDAWFFELLDMIHKLILTSLVPFLPNNMEMAANMIIIILYMQVILVLQPYVRKGDDRLHQIVQTELCLLAMLGWTLGSLETSNLDPTLDYLISILLIILTVFLLLAFSVMTLRNSFKLVQLVRRLRRKKNQQFQAERGGVLELCSSTLKKKNHAGVWQERFFVLCEDGFLEWYSNKSKEAIVGIIPVSQILSVREDPNPCRFAWDLKSEVTVSFELQARDAETCAKWVRSLSLMTAGNKVEKMDPAFTGRYWRDTAAMRMVRLQRSTSSQFKGSTGGENSS